MHSPFDRVPEDVIRQIVADGWRTRIDDLGYLSVGGGAYHWIARTGDGRRLFVTCDDLGTKPWLGTDPDSVFDELQRAYRTAMGLRAAGLSFVAAPIPDAAGAPARRVDEHHSLSVLHHIDGEPGEWGQALARGGADELVTMVARLHRSRPPDDVRRRRIAMADRDDFEDALGRLDRPWDGGPLSELARRELADGAGVVADWLAELDRVARVANGQRTTTVLTHGELHPGNIIRAEEGLALIDWDTVALARPERDLWMLAEADPTLVTRYVDLTGIAIDPDALRAHRLLWALDDLAAFTVQLRRPHERDADADRALTALRAILSGREPSPYGASRRRATR